MQKKIVIFLLYILFNCLQAQDIHWSQPSNSLIYQNPAFTGINGRYNVDAGYHTQWNAANSPFKTYMVAGDFRLKKKDKAKTILSLGGMALNDQAGDGKFKTTGGGLTISLLVRISKKLYVGAGFGGNMIQNSLQINNFSWGSQYDGTNYNSSASSGEINTTTSKFLPDFNTGISAAYDRSGGSASSKSTIKLIGGYSLNHITQPNIDMTGGVDKLKYKHTVMVTGLIGITKHIGIKPTFLGYMQGKLMELNGGALVRYSMGQQSKITGYKKGSAVSFGALYRLEDAIIPTVELEKGTLLLGMSYDINISRLSVASKFRGGFQISLKISNTSNYLYKNKAK